MPKFQIDEVSSGNPTYPLIVNFQNGYTTDKFSSQNCMVLENEKNSSKTLLLELNNLIYAGDEVKDELWKTLTLSRNNKTGKVRIIEVGSAELKPVLKISETSQLLETSNLELSRKFGSKKQKQQMEQREKLKVNVQTVTEQMQNITKNISEDQLDLSVYNKSDSDDFYIPPIDRTVDKVEDVYDINKILTEDQFEKIYSELEEKDYKTELLPILKNIVTSKKLSQEHTVLAVYANTLLKLYSTMVKDLKKTFVSCPQSATLNEIVLSNFTTMTNGRRTRPTPYKDKALCHAIVFILLINNLKFELESLCQDMKLTSNNASMKVRVTGASLIGTGPKKVVQLKLPLNNKSGLRRKSAKF